MWFAFLFRRQSPGYAPVALRSRGCGPKRRAAHRLGVEALEPRWCPSCTVYHKGDLLVIQGDQAENNIALADHRDKVRVTRDGQNMLFSGVRRFNIATGDGNDFVSVKKQPFPGNVTIATGRGNDRVVGEFSWGA